MGICSKKSLNFEDFIFQLAIEEEEAMRAQEYEAEHFYCKHAGLILLRKAPKQLKCMVSQLLLDFGKEKVIACPACLHLAKELYLERWLSVKDYCPACHTKITIDNCLTVKKVKRLNSEQRNFCRKRVMTSFPREKKTKI